MRVNQYLWNEELRKAPHANQLSRYEKIINIATVKANKNLHFETFITYKSSPVIDNTAYDAMATNA
jgi:hypothetical protein